MFRMVGISLIFAALVGCTEGRDNRYVDGIFNPVCAEDGSVVYVQYSNSQGSYENAKASRENCAWAKK